MKFMVEQNVYSLIILMFKIIHLNAAMIDIEILTCTCIGLHVDC